jgi:hypothetical protein
MHERKREKPETLADLMNAEEDYESEDHLSHGDRQTLEDSLRKRLDRADSDAADMGIKKRPWFHDDLAEEYHDYAAGLPDEMLNAEYRKGEAAIRTISSKDLDDTFEKQGMADELYDDFLSAGYTHIDKDDVQKAASRVIARYREEGTLNIERRVFDKREAFIDDVSIELNVGGYVSKGEGGHRTGGIGGIGGGSYGQPMRENDDEPLSSMIDSWQRKSGLY